MAGQTEAKLLLFVALLGVVIAELAWQHEVELDRRSLHVDNSGEEQIRDERCYSTSVYELKKKRERGAGWMHNQLRPHSRPSMSLRRLLLARRGH